MRKGLSEILDAVAKVPAKDRVDEICKHANQVLYDYIRLLHEKPEWDLPEGMMEYKKSIYFDDHLILLSEWRKIRQYFLKGSAPHVPVERKQKMYIQMLEMVHPKDAELVEYLRHGNTPYKWLTRKFVENAFPGLLPELPKKA